MHAGDKEVGVGFLKSPHKQRQHLLARSQDMMWSVTNVADDGYQNVKGQSVQHGPRLLLLLRTARLLAAIFKLLAV